MLRKVTVAAKTFGLLVVIYMGLGLFEIWR